MHILHKLNKLDIFTSCASFKKQKKLKKETIFVDMDNLVEIMNSNDRFIYHYTSAEIAREFILLNGTLKFSNINQLNDPEESTKYESLFLNNSDNHEKPDSINMLMNFRHTFPSLLFSASFCTDKKDEKSYEGKNYFETTGLHLNKGFMLSRMWGTYGDKHKGVCLCFDKIKLLDSFEKALPDNFDIYKDEVKYSRDIEDYISKYSKSEDSLSPTGVKANYNTFSEFKNHIITNKDFFFFMKQNDWRDENEFKIFLVQNDLQINSDIYLPIGNSLTAIFMGERFSLGQENNLFKHYCKLHNISAFRTIYKGGLTYARPFNFGYIND